MISFEFFIISKYVSFTIQINHHRVLLQCVIYYPIDIYSTVKENLYSNYLLNCLSYKQTKIQGHRYNVKFYIIYLFFFSLYHYQNWLATLNLIKE